MASYDAGLVPLYTAQYSTNLELLLQQKGSKLRGFVDTGSHVGKMASPIQQIAPITAKAPAGRFAPKDNTQATFVRRWVFPSELDVNQLLDGFDQLQTIVDPKSGYTQNAANAIGRAYDDSILTASTAASITGVDAGNLGSEAFGTSTTNYTTDTAMGYIIQDSFGASAATGLTVAKLIELKRSYRKFHVDLDEEGAVLIIGSQQEANLLSQQQIVSRDYNDAPVLKDGSLKRFLGFDIVVMERVPQSTVGTTRGCVSFVKSGVYLGIWRDLMNNVSQRLDLSSEPWQLYTQAMYGATRTQLGKVFQVNCADTTGADINP
jgi:hypothetical protein